MTPPASFPSSMNMIPFASNARRSASAREGKSGSPASKRAMVRSLTPEATARAGRDQSRAARAIRHCTGFTVTGFLQKTLASVLAPWQESGHRR